ncbi:MAG: hypothetical protein WBF03_23125 [Xanthobacteraceae bacterium]
MASIEPDDAMIPPHAANLDGSNFRKGQALHKAASQWKMPLRGWAEVKTEFAIMFDERFGAA